MSLLRLEEFVEAALASLDQVFSENGFVHVRLALFLSLEVEFKLDQFLTELSINDDELLLVLGLSENVLNNRVKKHLFDLIVTFELVGILGVLNIFFPAFLLSFIVLEHVVFELLEFSIEVVWRNKINGKLNPLHVGFLFTEFIFHVNGQLDEFLLLLIIFLSDKWILRNTASTRTPDFVITSSFISLEIVVSSLFVFYAVLNLTIYQRLMDDKFDISV